jgi:DNA anti-recombination protein RmuC
MKGDLHNIYQKDLEETTQEHTRELAAIRMQHAKEISDQEQEVENVLARLRDVRTTKDEAHRVFARTEQQLKQEKREMEKRLTALQRQHEEQLTSVNDQHQQAIALIQDQHRQQLEAIRVDCHSAFESKINATEELNCRMSERLISIENPVQIWARICGPETDNPSLKAQAPPSPYETKRRALTVCSMPPPRTRISSKPSSTS